jgi:GH35 family endo-1,4-beta-xylanase
MKKNIRLLAGLLVVLMGCMSAGAEFFASSQWTFVPPPGSPETNIVVSQALPLSIQPRVTDYYTYTPRWEHGLTQSLKAGRVYRVKIVARAVGALKSGKAALKVALSGAEKRGRFRPVFTCGPILSGEFETFTAPFTVPEDLSAEDVSLFLVHGWGDIPVEVQSVEMFDLGAELPLQAYARTGRWYAGQEPDASWRRRAEEMIDTNRKGTFRFQVIDARGEPVENARIIINQQSHAYRFGAAVNSTLARWIAPGADSNPALHSEFETYRVESGRTGLTFAERQAEIRKYFDVLQADFNYVVLENAFKWQAWCGEWGGFRQDETLAFSEWLTDRGIDVKGHALVWPGWGHSPAFVKTLSERPDSLSRVVDAHICEVGSAMNGRVVAVDVMNEAFNNNDYMKLLGNDVMAGWFKKARAVLPDAQLNVNDFLMIANGGYWTRKLDFYDNLVGDLLAAGAPLDAVGFQNHYRHTFLTGPERVWELCDRFGRHGLQLVCSEFDVSLADEALQAAFTRDFMTAWFAHPDTSAFLHWGFWQGSHWLPYAGLYDHDWQMKPNGKAYRDLVFRQWWTGWEEVRTDQDGIASLRGFLGAYRITVYANGSEKILENIILNKEGSILTVRL